MKLFLIGLFTFISAFAHSAVYVNPPVPVVNLSDFIGSYPDGTEYTYKAPWVPIQVTILNDTAEDLFISSIDYEIVASSGTVTKSRQLNMGMGPNIAVTWNWALDELPANDTNVYEVHVTVNGELQMSKSPVTFTTHFTTQ